MGGNVMISSRLFGCLALSVVCINIGSFCGAHESLTGSKDRWPVRLTLLESDCKTPVADVLVQVMRDRYPSRSAEPVAEGRTNEHGQVEIELPADNFYLRVESSRPLPGVAFHEPEIRVWRKQARQDFVRALDRGCQLTFRVLDVTTGRGVPGVSFWEENIGGEHWYHISTPDNFGITRSVDESKNRQNKAFQTNEAGEYSMLRRPQQGWTYYLHAPDGFEVVGPDHFDFSIPGEGNVERTFKVRPKQ